MVWLVWTSTGSTYKSRLHSLTILQKRALHFLAGVPYGSHIRQLLSDFGLLRVEQIRIAQIGEFKYRYDHDLLPLVFNGFFCRTSSIHSYNTRGSNSYRRDYAYTILVYSLSNLLVPWCGIISLSLFVLHLISWYSKKLRSPVAYRTGGRGGESPRAALVQGRQNRVEEK